MNIYKKEKTHSEILKTASHELRNKGLQGASVQNVMSKSGKTVGGFYAHFASKDEMVIEAMKEMFYEVTGYTDPLKQLQLESRFEKFLDMYLSTTHRDKPEVGCPVASLALEIGRDNQKLKNSFSSLFEGMVKSRADSFLGSKNQENIDQMLALTSAYVGAIILSRATKGTELSEKILKSTKHFLIK